MGPARLAHAGRAFWESGLVEGERVLPERGGSGVHQESAELLADTGYGQ